MAKKYTPMIEAMIDTFLESHGLDDNGNLKVTNKKLQEKCNSIFSKIILEKSVALYDDVQSADDEVDFQEKNADPSSMKMDKSPAKEKEEDDDMMESAFDPREIFEFKDEKFNFDDEDFHDDMEGEEDMEGEKGFHDEEEDPEYNDEEYSEYDHDHEFDDEDRDEFGHDDEFHDFEGSGEDDDLQDFNQFHGEEDDDDLGFRGNMNNELGQNAGDAFGGESEGEAFHDDNMTNDDAHGDFAHGEPEEDFFDTHEFDEETAEHEEGDDDMEDLEDTGDFHNSDEDDDFLNDDEEELHEEKKIAPKQFKKPVNKKEVLSIVPRGKPSAKKANLR